MLANVWRRLQPVGFSPCKDDPPQAEELVGHLDFEQASG